MQVPSITFYFQSSPFTLQTNYRNLLRYLHPCPKCPCNHHGIFSQDPTLRITWYTPTAIQDCYNQPCSNIYFNRNPVQHPCMATSFHNNSLKLIFVRLQSQQSTFFPFVVATVFMHRSSQLPFGYTTNRAKPTCQKL